MTQNFAGAAHQWNLGFGIDGLKWWEWHHLRPLVFQGALFSSMTFLGLGLAGLETVNCEVGWVLPGCRG